MYREIHLFLCAPRPQGHFVPVDEGVRNAPLSWMMLGWLMRLRMHTSLSTRLAFSLAPSTLGMRFRATCRGGQGKA
jgi:hypothetical protein